MIFVDCEKLPWIRGLEVARAKNYSSLSIFLTNLCYFLVFSIPQRLKVIFFMGAKSQGWSSALDETKRIIISKHNVNDICKLGIDSSTMLLYVIVQIFQQRICRGPKLFLPVIRQLNWVKEGKAWAWMKDVLAHSFQIRISVYIARLRA